VESGEFLSIMGPTGVGKTTLCLAMNGLVPQATGGVIRGRVRVLGLDTWHTPVAEMAAHVGIVYQDPETQLFCATVEDEVAFGPENLGLDRTEIRERIAWALDVVEMDEYRSRSPLQLSGGQKQRVAIAATLAMLPRVLILDEPTSNLDPRGQYEVLSAIERLRRENQMTIIMTSQDPEQVIRFSDRVALLWEGRIVCLDTPERVFGQRALLDQVGIATPQLMELARTLNARFGQQFAFLRLAEAESSLRQALTGTPSSP